MLNKSLLSGRGKGNTFSPFRIGKRKFDVENILAYIVFIGPAFVLFTLFFIYPLLGGLYYSFTDWDAASTQINMVGFKNYANLFTNDPNFMDSINRTFYIALINVFLTNVLAMTFAIALTSSFKLNNLFRAVIFLPNVISMVISGFIWQFMFTRISTSAYKATGLELFNVSWLGDTQNVIYAIVIVSLWQGLGYIMTIYIAGLMGVDESLVEAAEIDGASGWQVFFRIKLPVMLPVITVGAFLNIAGSLKIFDIIYSLTGGGPGRASEVAMLNIYREAFVFNRFGYGTAKAVILSIIIILITIIQLRITSRKEVDM